MILIQATTSAVSGAETQLILGDEKCLLVASDLATTEEVDVLVTLGDGSTLPWLDSSGAAVKLTATKYMAGIQGPGIVRLSKDATASACSVEYFK